MSKILVGLLFKNGMLWLDKFMNYVNRLLELDNTDFHFVVVYGDSKDDTDKEVKRRMNELSKKGYSISLIHLPLPRRLNGIEKLAILRNVVIVVSDLEKEKYDYVLSIDTDIMFDNAMIKKLIDDIKISDAGIVAPLVLIDNTDSVFYDTWAFRMKGHMFTSYKPYIPRQILKEQPNFMNGVKVGVIGEGSELIEVDSVGSFYICKADIFWKFNIKYFTEEILNRSKREQHIHRKYESEQVCFCNSVREKTDYKVYVDYGLNVYHVNLGMYGLEWH